MIKRKIYIVLFFGSIICTSLFNCKLKNNSNVLIKNDSVIIESKPEIKSDLIVKLYKLHSKIIVDTIFEHLLLHGQIIDTIAEDEISALTLIIDSTKNTLRFESYYKVGNSSLIITEYRAINLNNCTKLLHSKIIGTSAFTSQDIFEIYDYDSSKNTLKRDSLVERNFKVSITDFLSPETPDSIITELTSHVDIFFLIAYNAYGIAEIILDDHYGSNIMKENKWILGNIIRFDIKNDKIIRIGPFYDE